MTRIFTLGLGLASIVLLFILAAYLGFQKTLKKPKDLQFGAPVQIGRDIYQFPRNAHDFLPDRGGKPECMSLRILSPEMEGLTSTNAVEMDGLTQESGSLQLLLCDSSHSDRLLNSRWTPDQYTHRVAVGTLTDNPDISIVHALKDYDQQELFGGTQLSLKLNVPKTNFKTQQLDPDDRIIADIEGGKFLSFVACGNAKKFVNPGCNMQFGFRDISVTVHFRRSQLANWREIREKLKVFFERYRLKNISP
jgi:hypothetical protein